ncbi:MAG: extracellular solute-binding protein [Variovorax sp.]|nr:MAG: extracellular solute-binding protein [Variovorax sp.]
MRRLAWLGSAVVVAALVAGCAKPVMNTAPVNVSVYAAGSLRAPVTEAARAFERAHPGTQVALTFGASGLLRDRIVAGEAADVFASANMAHPQSLRAGGSHGDTRPFARNALCALVRPGLAVTPDTLVQTLLDPAVKLGISTPRADPSGDYAITLFENIERTGAAAPGSAQALTAKALQLTGGPTSPPPPVGRDVYGMLVATGQADVFLTYCTNAVIARAEEPSLQQVDVPPAINVSAQYGLALRQGAGPAAQAFAESLISGAGQASLRKAGFLSP